jgi:hypothetical protein
MQNICESLDQKELLSFWISELTDFTPQQVETVIKAMKERKTSKQQVKA